MDHSILARLRNQVLYDLGEFMPKGCFKLEGNFAFNGRELSWDEKWGMVAMAIAARLYYESKAQLIAVSPRQSIAIELLEHLGNLASCEATTNPQSERDKATDSILHTSLEKYLCYLPEHEAKPFVSLLEPKNKNEDEPKRQDHQESEILRVICEVLKYDPQKLPSKEPGKPWVKSKVRKNLNIPSKPFQSDNVFDRAWERLLSKKRIKEV